MGSSGMLCHVVLVRTGVSEESIASIIRVTRIGDLGMTLTITSNPSTQQYFPTKLCSYKNHTA
jgi:hypothetical protein